MLFGQIILFLLLFSLTINARFKKKRCFILHPSIQFVRFERSSCRDVIAHNAPLPPTTRKWKTIDTFLAWLHTNVCEKLWHKSGDMAGKIQELNESVVIRSLRRFRDRYFPNSKAVENRLTPDDAPGFMDNLPVRQVWINGHVTWCN